MKVTLGIPFLRSGKVCQLTLTFGKSPIFCINTFYVAAAILLESVDEEKASGVSSIYTSCPGENVDVPITGF